MITTEWLVIGILIIKVVILDYKFYKLKEKFDVFAGMFMKLSYKKEKENV